MEIFTDILQWLIPAGSLGSVAVWLFSKTLRNLRQTKEVHDTYKTLYKDISNELGELHKELGRFRRAISKIYGCRYYSDCPVRRELQDGAIGNGNKVGKSNGQPRIRNQVVEIAENSTGPGSESKPDDTDTEPP
jgi:hypothetical protein